MNHAKPNFDLNSTFEERRLQKNYTSMARIGDIAHLHKEISRNVSEYAGIPNSYRAVLFHLSILTPGVTQLTLVKATQLKAPTISVTLQKMEAEGLITRVSNEKDLRETLVYLSDKGKKIMDKILSSIVSADNAAMVGFSDEEKVTLNAFLDRIIDNLASYK